MKSAIEKSQSSAEIECYRGAEVAAREVLIKFGPATPDSIIEAKAAEDINYEQPLGNGVLWWRSVTKDVPTLIGDLSTRSGVEYVEPNYIAHIAHVD